MIFRYRNIFTFSWIVNSYGVLMVHNYIATGENVVMNPVVAFSSFTFNKSEWTATFVWNKS